MKQYQYAKVPASSASILGLDKVRKQLHDGSYIVNESDLLTYGGSDQSFEEKITDLKGKIITSFEAKQELQKARKS